MSDTPFERERNPDNKDSEIVNQALATLREHFDSVQIFCTRHEPTVEDGTVFIIRGSGDWFARYGRVKTWLIRQEEKEKEIARREQDKEMGDDN